MAVPRIAASHSLQRTRPRKSGRDHRPGRQTPLRPALASFHYNTGAIARAALTRALNAGDQAAAGAAFMNWVRPASLRPRREAERDLFRHGRYPEGPIPVWAADVDGRVDFSRTVRRLGATEALTLLRPMPAPTTTASPPPATPQEVPRPPSLLTRLRDALAFSRARL